MGEVMIKEGFLEEAGLERWVDFQQAKEGLRYGVYTRSRESSVDQCDCYGPKIMRETDANKGSESQIVGVWRNKVIRRT